MLSFADFVEMDPLGHVENVGKWFRRNTRSTLHKRFYQPDYIERWEFILGRSRKCEGSVGGDLRAFINELRDVKIGEITTMWADSWPPHEWRSGLIIEEGLPIEFKHAKIKLGDVFEYYTVDRVLKIPNWASFKYAVEEYLENDPRIKYHPTRVEQFIDEKGLEHLEEMQ